MTADAFYDNHMIYRVLITKNYYNYSI